MILMYLHQDFWFYIRVDYQLYFRIAIIMKYIFTFFLLGFLGFNTYSQPDCTPRLDEVDRLTNNFRRSAIFSLGSLSFDGQNSEPFFDGDGVSKLFDVGYARGVWAGGYDSAGNIRLAASGYDGDSADYIPGPIWRGFQSDTELCEYFRRVWTINNYDISILLDRFESGTLEVEDIPRDILEWPALGNPHIKEFEIENDLAPFFDKDGDGRYDPLNGDYPIPLVENPLFIPSKFRFYVFNDMTEHNESRGIPMDMEFQLMDWVTTCPSPGASEASVFTRMKYIYKGLEDLRDFRIGIWDDMDLGCHTNDYIGCDPTLNASYAYNAGGVEPSSCEGGITGIPEEYGAIKSHVFLNAKLKKFIYFYNGGVGNPPPQQTDPSVVEHYYNYLDGKWLSGTPLTLGGSGLNPASSEVTDHAFTDIPTLAGGWSMQEENSALSDPRTISVFSVDDVLSPSQSGTVDFVDNVLISETNTGLSIFDLYESNIQNLQEDYAAMLSGQYECGTAPVLCTLDCVWPGDVNNDGLVTGRDMVMIGNYLGLGGEMGPPRSSIDFYWFPFSSIDWERGLFDLDAKYADVDGSGEVNLIDLSRGSQNLGSARTEWYPDDLLQESDEGDVLHIDYFDEDSIDATSTSFFEKLITARLSLGESGVDLMEPIHGLSYEVRFDTNMVVLNDLFYFPGIIFDRNGSYTGELEERDDLYYGSNRVSYYHTNVDGTNFTTSITLPSPSFTLRDDAMTANPDGRDTLVIKYYNVFGTNAAGEELSFGAAYNRIIVTNMIVDPDLVSGVSDDYGDFAELFSLHPNPATDLLKINFQDPINGDLILHSASGDRIGSYKLFYEDQLALPVSALEKGLYFLTLRTENGNSASKRFIKL